MVEPISLTPYPTQPTLTKGSRTVKENAEFDQTFVVSRWSDRKLADAFHHPVRIRPVTPNNVIQSPSGKPTEEPQTTMTQSRIQVVFFDAADTLFHIHGSVADLYLQYPEKHGFKKTGESLGSHQAAFRTSLFQSPHAGT